MRKDKLNTDRKVDTIKRRLDNLKCSICPPNRGENLKSHSKYGDTKPKHKDKRRNLIDV